jgi:hypothetical protein
MEEPERDEPEAAAEDLEDLELLPGEADEVKGGMTVPGSGGTHGGPPPGLH